MIKIDEKSKIRNQKISNKIETKKQRKQDYIIVQLSACLQV